MDAKKDFQGGPRWVRERGSHVNGELARCRAGRARLASRSRLLAGWGSWGRSMHRSLRGRRRVLGAVESGATGGWAPWTAPRKGEPEGGALAGGWVDDDTVTDPAAESGGARAVVPSPGRAAGVHRTPELQGENIPFPSLVSFHLPEQGRACLILGLHSAATVILFLVGPPKGREIPGKSAWPRMDFFHFYI